MGQFIPDESHLCDVLGIPFSREQLDAITAPPDQPSVIVAGAGSGKTTVMAARVVWLVGHHGLPPGRVLGLTFTKKAAAELGRRIRADLLAMTEVGTVLDLFDAEGEPTVATYNAFAGSLIAEHGLRLGLETDLVVEADAMRYQRAERVVRRYRGHLPHLATKMPATVDRVLALDSALSEHLVGPERLREYDEKTIAVVSALPDRTQPLDKALDAARQRVDLSRLVEAYRADKAVAGVMDFSDQMAGGARLGIECPEVGEMLRDRFDAVLLDEYQDTSVAQRLMLQGLFSGPDAEQGRGHPITAVGDPAQGIYGWRGASSDNIERFQEHFPARDGSAGPRFGLRASLRCHPDILAAANAVAQPYYESRSGLDPLHPVRGAVVGAAELTVARHVAISDEFQAIVDEVVAARERHPDESIAVLLRTRAEMPALTAALRSRGVDAEVVGLAGLLSLPHVVDVVSLLDVVSDATANPSMLRLLTGDRWRIGPRDLALLGRRAAAMAAGVADADDDSLPGRLAEAVSGSDPTEVVSLSDAVEDPGDLPYSAEARERFAEIAAVVRSVRRALGASVVDLVQLAIRRLDLDIETALLDTGAGDDLAALVDVAGDVSGRGTIDSLPAFLAYLRAEDEIGQGLEVPVRARPGAVQVLTIHTAKGLEWDRVFVPFVVGGGFPSTQGRDRWTSNAKGFPHPLRGDSDVLPRLSQWSSQGLTKLTEDFRADDLFEEMRLAYVAFTRARTALHVSGHWWGRTQKTVRKASPFLDAVHDVCRRQGRTIGPWALAPTGAENPELAVRPVEWPRPPAVLERRRQAAELVTAAADGRLEVPPPAGNDAESAELAALSALDAEIEALRDEAARAAGAIEVVLPASLSTTAVLALAEDEREFAKSLARPMPRTPSAAARLGTRFHAWVEAHFGQQVLLDPTELPGRGDTDLDSDAELEEVIELFRTGPYGESVPYAIETPFSVVLGGQQVIGRIDAVYRLDDGFEVVDWKTNREATADPLQLAVYRLAWAESSGVDPDDVSAAFYYVRLGQVQRFTDLPGRAELDEILAGETLTS